MYQVEEPRLLPEMASMKVPPKRKGNRVLWKAVMPQ